MSGKGISNTILFGLEDDLAAGLRREMSGQARAVYSFPFLAASECLALIDEARADLVFCAAEPERYRLLLDAVRLKKPGLPIVVVSRRGEVTEWLNALEAGASDYCAPPFESTQLRWILESALKSWALKSQIAAA